MYCAILAVAVLNFCAATENISSDHIANQLQATSNVTAKRLHNTTYLDKEENMLKMPVLKNHFEEHQAKQKKKKPPKSIIQKIIKKRKSKLRKIYFNQATKHSTMKPNVMHDTNWANNDLQNRETTTHPTHKHRSKNSNVNYYRMPFQKLQRNERRSERRHKRGLSKELTALKEFDQVPYLSKEKDTDIFYAPTTDSMMALIQE